MENYTELLANSERSLKTTSKKPFLMVTVAALALVGVYCISATRSDVQQSSPTLLATKEGFLFEGDILEGVRSEKDTFTKESLLSLASASLPATQYAGLKVAFEFATTRGNYFSAQPD